VSAFAQRPASPLSASKPRLSAFLVAGGFGLVGLGVATWSLTGPALTEAARTGSGHVALENVVLRPPGDPLARSLADWAEQDPAAAWRWALAQLAEDGDAWQGVLARIARPDPARALGCATQLAHDRPDLAQIAYATVIDTLAQMGSYAAAQRALQQIPDGDMKSHLVTNFVLQWGRSDPLNAAAWLLSLPGAVERPAAFVGLSRAWAEADPQEAADFAALLPAGELRRSALTAALTVWIEKSPGAASAWIDQLDPHPDLDQVAARISRIPILVETRVEVALSWAETIVDENERTQALATVVTLWAARDRLAAVRYVQVSPDLTSAQRARLMEDIGSS
jgi:hypothetical protein